MHKSPHFLRSLIAAFMLTAFAPMSAALADPAQANSTPAKQAIMIDYETGMVLFEKNADDRMAPSSMSKEMTMYAVFDALKEGRITLDQSFPISEKAWRMQGSKMFVPIHGQVKVEDLVRGVIIQSGNDASIALAEGVSGSEEAFSRLLNEKAAKLGMKNSNFTNASGWPDPNHYTTARDLVILGYHTVHDFPEYYHYYSEIDFTYNNIKQGNRNPLLYRNIGGDGIKTGHTEEGGYGLMGSGERNGRRVIFVVNGLESMQQRADESARLLDWGLKNFENVTIFNAGDKIVDAPVVMGTAASVPLSIDSRAVVTLAYNTRSSLKVEAVYNGPLKAPVKKGDVVGKLIINAPRVEALEIPLLATEDVAALTSYKAWLAKLKLMLAAKKGGQEPTTAL